MTLLHVLGLTLPVLVPGLVLIATLRRGGFARLRQPIDGGAVWCGRPVLGENKTWYGLLLYVAGGAATGSLLSLGGTVVDPVLHGPRGSLVGATAGAAYAFGELINSAIKRRLGIAAGRMAPGVSGRLQRAADLADGVFAASCIYLAWGVSLGTAGGVLVAGIAIHMATDALMRRLRLKRHEGRGRRDGDRDVVGTPRTDALDKGERHP